MAETSAAAVAATAWVTAVVDGDLVRSWELTDPDARLSRAQGWQWAHGRTGRSSRELADEIAQHGSTAPHWADFWQWSVTRWRDVVALVCEGSWDVLDTTEILGPDLELAVVVATDAGAPEPVAPGEPLVAQLLVMRFDGEWRVAGLGRMLAVPGWPPSEVEVYPSGGG